MSSRFFSAVLFTACSFFASAAMAAEYSHTYRFEKPQVIEVYGIYVQLSINDTWQKTRAIGAPILPARTSNLLIPDSETVVEVKIETVGVEKLSGSYQVHFSTPPKPTDETVVVEEYETDYAPDPQIYGLDSPFPAVSQTEWRIRNIHGSKIISTLLNPVSYQPASGTVSWYPEIRVTITTSSASPSAINGALSARNLETDHQQILSVIDNPETFNNQVPSLLPPAPDSDRQYLIITREEFIPAFDPLIAHRESEAGGSFTTHIETMESILQTQTGVDNAEKVRNYIIDSYLNHGTQFVLLGGDADGNIINEQSVPIRGARASVSSITDSGIPTDLYYACLDGSWNSDGDNYWGESNDGIDGGDIDWDPEVFVGRIAADDITEFGNQIQKIITFETNPRPFMTLLAAEKLDSYPTWGADRIDYVYQGMAEMPFETLYDKDNPSGSWDSSEITSHINSNLFSWINHLGHANDTYGLRMYSSQLSNLNNTQPVFVYTQGCYSGNLQYNDSFAETITTMSGGGAFAIISNSRYGWYNRVDLDAASNRVHRKFVEEVMLNLENRLGAANQLSKTHLDYTESVDRWNAFTTNLLGDPATTLIDSELNRYTVSAQASEGGRISPLFRIVVEGGTTHFTLTPDYGYRVLEASGCNGTLIGNIYETGAITDNCSVNATFELKPTHTVGGTVSGFDGSSLEIRHLDETISITEDGSFTFTGEVPEEEPYSVSITAQPSHQYCQIANGNGVMGTADITDIEVTCENIYTIGGAVSGINSGTLKLSNNGERISIEEDGTFTFENQYRSGLPYSVTVYSNPFGHECSVSNGSGVIDSDHITDIQVSCIDNTRSVGGTVTGLTQSGLELYNRGEYLVISSNGEFSFRTPHVRGYTYNVSISNQPVGQYCIITNGYGTVADADITSVEVHCADAYTVGGTISNLDGSVQLKLSYINGGSEPDGDEDGAADGAQDGVDDGAEDGDGDYFVPPLATETEYLTITNPGNFNFLNHLLPDSEYTVEVSRQPEEQVCTVINPSGIVGNENVSNIIVECHPSFSIGGTITGITSGTVRLKNNGDTLSYSGNGTFAFNQRQLANTDYNITVSSPPTNHTCTVENGQGTVAASDVTDIIITCEDHTHSVGGTVTGMNGGTLRIRERNSYYYKYIYEDGPFTLSSRVLEGEEYDVYIYSQPTNQFCVIENGSGIMGDEDVTNIIITCQPTYSISVTSTGIARSGLRLVNNNNTLSVNSNGIYTFSSRQVTGSEYAVQISELPYGQTCSLSNNSGIIEGQNVNDIEVSCVDHTKPFSGTIDGLSDGNSVRLQLKYNYTFFDGSDDGDGDGDGSPDGAEDGDIDGSADGAEDGDVDGGYDGSQDGDSDGDGDPDFENSPAYPSYLYATETFYDNGEFTFNATILPGAEYTLSIYQQPSMQLCQITNGATGTVPENGVTDVTIVCEDTYSISGTVSGLNAGSFKLSNNDDTRYISSNGSFSFYTRMISGSTYDVQTISLPYGHTCLVSNGSGIVADSDISDIEVICTDNRRTIGGNVSGISGNGLRLRLQGNPTYIYDYLSIAENGDYSFSKTIAPGESYSVSIYEEPTGQQCEISNSSGTVADENITDVNVVCHELYSIGGSVNGLNEGSLKITNNGENKYIYNNGSFSFSRQQIPGTTYSVAVDNQPYGHTCNASKASGTITDHDISDIEIDCVDNRHSLGGTVSGLTGSGFRIKHSSSDTGSSYLTLSSDGSFTFPKLQASGADYTVTILNQPANQICNIENSSGTFAEEDITDISISCETAYSIGGTLNGINAGTLKLLNNGESLSLTQNSSFKFQTQVVSGGTYAVSVSTQPYGHTCTIENESGTVAEQDITDITISCIDERRTVSGTVSGLENSGLVLGIGSIWFNYDEMPISDNGPFTVDKYYVKDDSYNVRVAQHPINQQCQVLNGSGTITDSNITDIEVICKNTYTLGGSVTGLNDGTLKLENGDALRFVYESGDFQFSGRLVSGSSYNITVKEQPYGHTCTITNPLGIISDHDITDIEIICVDNRHTIGGTVSGLSGGDLRLRSGNSSSSYEYLTITENGSFHFPKLWAPNDYFVVSIQSKPFDQGCEIKNASGYMPDHNVTDIEVICQDTFVIGGSVIGLNDETLKIKKNSEAEISITESGDFKFSKRQYPESTYEISITSQPYGHSCSVENGSGIVPDQNVSDIRIVCIDNRKSIGGNVIGLTGDGLELSLKNYTSGPTIDTVDIADNGPFAFEKKLKPSSAYWVSVSRQPTGQLCKINNQSGGIIAHDITDIEVICEKGYSVDGTITGLRNNSSISISYNDETLSFRNDSDFKFEKLNYPQTSYSVSIDDVPYGHDCTVLNGNGTIGNSDVTDVYINCIDNTKSIGGSIYGLNYRQINLMMRTLNNSITSSFSTNRDGDFVFPHGVKKGETYELLTWGAPSGCHFSNARAVVGDTDVSNIIINCDQKYTVGGKVNGVNAPGLQLRLNNDIIDIDTNRDFHFDERFTSGSVYHVYIESTPENHNCSINNASGTINNSDSLEIVVNCSSSDYSIGGSVSGLEYSGLIIADSDHQEIEINHNGSFTLPDRRSYGETYSVQVISQPGDQFCSVENATGYVTNSNITNIQINCNTRYTLSGTISGINDSGLRLLINNTEKVIETDGVYVLKDNILSGDTYLVKIASLPEGKGCRISNGAGTITNHDVSDVSIDCFNTYKLGGNVSGLSSGTLVLRGNNEEVSVTSNGEFQFIQGVASGFDYNVEIISQPDNHICTISNASGTVGESDIDNIQVQCVSTWQCQQYTSTNDQHVAAGRATVQSSGWWWFITNTYYATGSNDNLGNNGAQQVALKENPEGYFSLGSCPARPQPPEFITHGFAVNGPVVNFSGTVKDVNNDISHIILYTPAGEVRCNGTEQFSCSWEAPTHGSYSFGLQAFDLTGLASERKELTASIRPPEPPKINSHETNVSGKTITISGFASDRNNDLDRIVVEGLPFTCSGTTSYTCTAQNVDAGTYSLSLFAIDELDQRSGAINLQVTVDPAPSCYTSTNLDHTAAGRAYAFYNIIYYATGSRQYLGLGNAVTSLQEVSQGNWQIVNSCQ